MRGINFFTCSDSQTPSFLGIRISDMIDVYKRQCVVGAATTTKLTSHVAWFYVTVTPTQEEEQSLTLTSVGNILEDDNGYGKVFTFEANLGDKQLSDMVLKYDDTPATLLEGTAAPSIDGNAKFGIIVKSVSREKIESFDGSDVTLSFN